MITTSATYRSRTSTEPSPVDRVEPVIWGDPTGGPLTRDESTAYERDGLLVFEQLLDDGEVDRLGKDLQHLTRDPRLDGDDRVIREPDGRAVRSVFEVHRLSDAVADLATDPRLLDRAEQILGSAAHLHQTRVNFKPGFRGREFYWHSDFETWHMEDGMPQMRAVSVSVNLTPNLDCNGSLMIVPASHRTFVGCAGATPDEHFRASLRQQEYGTPSDEALARLVEAGGITQIQAPAGSAVFFDSNCMHGSNGNITPYPRNNVFLVYNSVENALVEPFGGTTPRPSYIAAREVHPLG